MNKKSIEHLLNVGIWNYAIGENIDLTQNTFHMADPNIINVICFFIKFVC